MFGFLLGAIAGAVAATYWRGDVNRWRGDVDRFRTERMPELRQQAADKLEAAERAIVGALDNASTKAASYLRGRHDNAGREKTDRSMHAD
jgi:hypothetical protein